MKYCNTCKETKELTEFSINRAFKNGYHWRCKPCDNQARKDWRKARGGKSYKESRSSRAWSLKKNYNITLQEYDKLLESQGHKCAICDTPHEEAQPSKRCKYLFVDHCHDTGKVRGLLCMKCNSGIGCFKEDSSVLSKALDYLNNQVDWGLHYT